jgi:hypothetical protein
MCVFSAPKTPDIKQPSVPDPGGREAIEQGRLEARLRRRRAGAAADVLTSPTGIPARATLGGS